MSTTENAVRRYERALLAVWDSADESARTYGASWYGDALTTCEQLAREYSFTVRQVVGAVAALSPRVQWHQNISDARTLLAWAEDERDGTAPFHIPLRGLGLSAFVANAEKAAECLSVDDPLTVLNGPKQRAFYRNISGDLNGVTIDVWATRAATRGARDTPGRDYPLFERAYRRAARRVGVAPRDFQAGVWIAARGRA